MEALLIFADFIMAVGAWAIASSKGRFGFGYFLLALFVPLIGLLIAIGMSSKRVQTVVIAQPLSRDMGKCPSCGVIIQRGASKCRVCGAALL